MKKLFATLLITTGIGILSLSVYSLSNSFKKVDFFKVKHVEIAGILNSDKDKLGHLGSTLVGRSIFDENLSSMLVTDDAWIQKIVASRLLPNKVVITVFEEKELFRYKVSKNCYSYTANGKSVPFTCDKSVAIKSNVLLDEDRGNKFYNILSKNMWLDSKKIVMDEFQFKIYEKGYVFLGSYDELVFSNNYKLYESTIKKRYRSVESVNLSIDNKVYVKGVKNVSTKG